MIEKTAKDVAAANVTVVTGAEADLTIKGGGCAWIGLRVWTVGAGSSKIEIYDGTVAAGTKIDEIPCTAVTEVTRCWKVEDGLHVKATDSGDSMKVSIAYL